MNTEETNKIVIEATINRPIEKVWDLWTQPEHITKWNNASDEWFTPKAENDLRTGGKFVYRMEAKDGSFGFDFSGVYDEVDTHKTITYSLEDGRKTTISFTGDEQDTKVVETFDPESTNPIELQRDGWLAILNNFKKYAEAN